MRKKAEKIEKNFPEPLDGLYLLVYNIGKVVESG